MGRWRPPTGPSTALITREGFERLKAELDVLWRETRPEVVRALSAAAAEGDRSENAEYHYRKKQLGEIDRRVRYLSKRIPELKVVEHPPADAEAVFFGAWVELETASSPIPVRYRIVGPDETDARQGLISIDSPLARALLKRRVDDTVVAHLPDGPREYEVVAVRYGGASGDERQER
jgi:transcription elongation factor GreB